MFVAVNLFWYPVEGKPKIRIAPDVMVVFGRPKGDRRSYLQWLEGGIPPQATFEIVPPGNRSWEMERRLLFYENHGVHEYYQYDPELVELFGWQRSGDKLQPIAGIDSWTSPLLGIKFDLSKTELKIIGPDGQPFLTALEPGQDLDRER